MDLTPKEIVKELDKYIIGQNNAKRSVAIALRNRWRRRQVPEDLRDEIAPKNIILIGPTGVGKTEIARRLSRLTDSPFYKVEASKFTEVGYVGRDVESMIRDLLELAINMLKTKEHEIVKEKSKLLAEERMLDILLPKTKDTKIDPHKEDQIAQKDQKDDKGSTREKLRKMLQDGKLDDRYIELDVADKSSMPVVEIFSNVGMEEMGINFKDMFGSMLPKQTKHRRVKVPEGLEIMTQEEAQNLIDLEKLVENAKKKVEQTGIIFLDEIDKITDSDNGHGPDISREGVQRDLLPIVEGSSVNTKHGPVKTDHILFIASGAFHTVKPSDLIPELQGRFPIRVELSSLGAEEFVRILTEPKNALLLQYKELLKTEKLELIFDDKSIQEIANISEEVNNITEDIGARRLHTVMERILEDYLFDAPDLKGQEITITAEYVRKKLADIKENEDLSRYIL